MRNNVRPTLEKRPIDPTYRNIFEIGEKKLREMKKLTINFWIVFKCLC